MWDPFTNNLPHTCVILGKSHSQDSIGGDSGGYSEVAGSNFKCYIGSIQSNERISGGIETEFSDNKLSYPLTVNLNKSQLIKCVTGPDHIGESFEVLPIKTVKEHHKTAYLRMLP